MSAPPAPFPWEEASAFCLGVLGWTPDTFWAATPRELAAALGPHTSRAPSRGDLAALMAAFPDTRTP